MYDDVRYPIAVILQRPRATTSTPTLPTRCFPGGPQRLAPIRAHALFKLYLNIPRANRLSVLSAQWCARGPATLVYTIRIYIRDGAT